MKTLKIVVSTLVLAMMIISVFAVLPSEALITPNTLSVSGSSTVYPISDDAEEDFEAAHSGMNIVPTSVGSGAGIAAWQAGTVDMAASSEMPISEVGASNDVFSSSYPYKGISDPQAFALGRDGVAFIVPSTNTWISEIDTETVVKIYTGEYTNWQQVPGLSGAPDQTIQVVGRITTSGTFDGFKSFFLKAYGLSTGDLVGTYIPITTNAQLLSDMQSGTYPYGIAFIGLGFVENNPPNVTPLDLWNPTISSYVEPKIANVNAGTYVSDGPSFSAPKVVARWLWYFMDGLPTAGTADQLKSTWISFVKTDDSYISDNGYIPMNRADMAGTEADNPHATIGTQTLPDTIVNYSDITYFVSAYIQYNGASNKVNPYADFDADGQVAYSDITGFVAAYIAYNS